MNLMRLESVYDLPRVDEMVRQEREPSSKCECTICALRFFVCFRLVSRATASLRSIAIRVLLFAISSSVLRVWQRRLAHRIFVDHPILHDHGKVFRGVLNQFDVRYRVAVNQQ